MLKGKKRYLKRLAKYVNEITSKNVCMGWISVIGVGWQGTLPDTATTRLEGVKSQVTSNQGDIN